MKYRRLTDEELRELEPDFINFLAANTITSDDWIQIKQEFPDRANNLIELFSDIVLEKVLSKIDVLEARSRNMIQYVTFSDSEIKMIGIKIENNNHLDLTKGNTSEEIDECIKKYGGKLQLISGSKQIEETINKSKFQMLEKNYAICKDKSLFNTLSELERENSSS